MIYLIAAPAESQLNLLVEISVPRELGHARVNYSS